MSENKTTGAAQRDFGADVVRVTAGLMVLTLHFFLRNGFYYSELTDIWGYLAITVRSVTMCCVPLFTVLTGYLKCGHSWGPGYYRSLLPIMISYVLISAVHLVYKLVFTGADLTAGEWAREFLGYQLANYGWYVGMYTGLFLLIPLLNMIWRGCSGRRQHEAVLLTLTAVSFLPRTLNNAFGGSPDVLPGYFTQLSYVAYYFIGAYIRTYRPRISRAVSAAAVTAIAAAVGAANILTRTDPANFYTGAGPGFSDLPVVAMTVLIFLALYRTERVSLQVRSAAARLSGVIFETYLLSFIPDSNIYPMFYKQYPMSLYLPVGALMVGTVLITSAAAGAAVHRLSTALSGRILGAGRARPGRSRRRGAQTEQL